MDNDHPPLTRIIEEELLDFYVRSLFFHPAYVRTLGLTGTERVLEFGSGGGCLSRALASVLSPDGELSCVEISPYWIRKAQQRLKAYPVIEYLQGEITHLNLPENHFDAVIVHFVLHDIDPKERINVVNALAKTLRPEGTLFIREPAKPSHGMPLAEIRSLMRDCGLREIRAGCTKSWQWKWICDGVFMKSW